MSESVEKPSKCLSLCIYAMCNDCNVWKETNMVSVLMRLFVALDMWEWFSWINFWQKPHKQDINLDYNCCCFSPTNLITLLQIFTRLTTLSHLSWGECKEHGFVISCSCAMWNFACGILQTFVLDPTEPSDIIVVLWTLSRCMFFFI